MSDIIKKLAKDPVDILDKSVESTDALALVKEFFDPIAKGNSVLEEIFIDGLDASQVWSQAKIILDSTTESLLFEKIPSLKSKNGSALGVNGGDDDAEDSELEEQISSNEEDSDNSEEDEQERLNEDEYESNDEIDEQGELVDDFEEEPLSGEDDEEGEVQDNQDEENEVVKKDAFGLNDEFFSIDDFNKQIMAQEGGNKDDEEEEVDYFNDLSDSDDDEEVLYYRDFFPPPKKKWTFKDKRNPSKQKRSVKLQDSYKEGDEEEEDLGEEDYDTGMKSAMTDLFDDDEPGAEIETAKESLSSFERQQQQIQREIAQLETEAIAEKKWAMKGESKAKDRPSDALLNEDLEFDRTAKPVPVITREVTESLEEMIRRRIKEENFDDLPKRMMTEATNFKPSSDFQLSETKSSKSLAELYEDDFKGTDDNSAVSEKLQQAHDEIKTLYQSLSHKLDSLCSAHFIPKPAQKSIDIKVNAPTISMEDAQPLTSSNANSLAPQEIFKTKSSANDSEIQLKSGTVFSRDELSREDKQRLRRANKRKRSKEFQSQDPSKVKKSKKQNVIDTLSKANNVTIINDKGEKRDVSGALKKDKAKQGTSMLKL